MKKIRKPLLNFRGPEKEEIQACLTGLLPSLHPEMKEWVHCKNKGKAKSLPFLPCKVQEGTYCHTSIQLFFHGELTMGKSKVMKVMIIHTYR